LQKYGIDSYDIEFLYEGDDFREEEERILKEIDAANDDMSYNMKNEALGGSFFGEKNGMFGKKLTTDQKIRCGNAFRGKKRPEHSEAMTGNNNPRYGKSDHTWGLNMYSKSRKGKTNKELFGEDKAKDIADKIRKGNLGKSKPGTALANRGGGNPAAKAIVFEGILYDCIKSAMVAT